jgi:LPS-assembly lipoprotein
MSIFKIILIALIFQVITGCGFKLQGKHELPEVLKKLTIIAANTNDPFQKLLNNSLSQNGVEIIQDSKNIKVTVLEINSPVFNEQISSYDSKGQISQYRLIATVSYRLFAVNGDILRQNTINKFRNYSIDPNKLLSNFNEQQIIKEELNIEIVNELLKQLSKCNSQ